MYLELEWASEASGITSSNKVRSLKRANNLYCLIGEKIEIKGKEKRRKTKRRKGNVVSRGDMG